MGFRNSDLTDGGHEITHTLDEIRRVRSDAEFATLIRALNIVACAFRLLTIHELSEALTTDISIPFGSQKWEDDIAHSQGSQDLKSLCIGLLDVRDSGVVGFSSDTVKHFVCSGNLATFSGGDGHENLAMASLRHLQYLDSGTILEPEQSTQRYTTPMRHTCAFLDYAVTFWHRHSRIADAYSRYVPAILHKTFVRAITAHQEYQPTLKEEIDTGLWLCIFYGFRILCRTYLEMGADPNSRAAWHASPLHTAAKFAEADLVRLLLDRGGDLALRNEEGLTPLQIALGNGNFDAANVFIERRLGVNACQPSTAISTPCARPQLQLDGLHGHRNTTKSKLSRSRTEAASCHVEALAHTMELKGPKRHSVLLIRLSVGRHHGTSMVALRMARTRRNKLIAKLRTKGLVASVHSCNTLQTVGPNLSGSRWLLILDDTSAPYNSDKFSLPGERRRVLQERLRGVLLQQRSSEDDVESHGDRKLGMMVLRWSRLFWLRLFWLKLFWLQRRR
jgi:Ankyrin repeats (many copies)